MPTPQLTQSQFKTFLLIYAAHVDYEYSEQEAYLIKALSRANEYEEMYAMFQSRSDYQSLKVIMANKGLYFQDESSRQKLYQIIEELFKIDGNYSRPEKVFLKFLDKLIETEAYGPQT